MKEKKDINLGLGTGRRKTSIARVYLREGKGVITVNHRTVDEYFKDSMNVNLVRKPLEITDNLKNFDVLINVKGGGVAGQAGACRHGITRALISYDDTLKPVLKAAGFVTRDPRMVERKKPGQKGARAKFQFSKR